MKEIRCGGCNRLLARAGLFDQIQIKCPRCRTLNHLKAESLLQAPPSASCRQEASCPPNPSSPG
nr:Com family DNA-binding transcriptional regulator [Pseudomonas pseudonitroreducens]